jgi:hypothetical protein
LPEPVAGFESVTVVDELTLEIIVPLGMSAPSIGSPLSACEKFAVADVNPCEPLVATPSVKEGTAVAAATNWPETKLPGGIGVVPPAFVKLTDTKFPEMKPVPKTVMYPPGTVLVGYSLTTRYDIAQFW